MGVPRHSIEDCEAFKTMVRKLLACGQLDIQKEAGPNIATNPLPNHEGRNQINALTPEDIRVREVMNVHTPMIEIFRGLEKTGYQVKAPAAFVEEGEQHEQDCSCVYHGGAKGHDIEECCEFKARVQSLLTMGVIVVAGKSNSPEEVDVIERFVLRVPP